MYGDVIFKYFVFNKDVSFENTKFSGNSHSEFCIADFSNSKFNDNLYFNNSNFDIYVDFHECEFSGVANFF